MSTKDLNGDQTDYFTKMLDMEHREGRASLAPEVHKLIKNQRCVRFNSSETRVTKRVKSALKAEVSVEEKCVAGLQSWVCPNPKECMCNNIIMYCAYSQRFS